jgi:tetratricopeptide (TPR) repeat protein
LKSCEDSIKSHNSKMDNLDYIDSFFKNELLPGEATRFEQKIATDPAFAEEVAFYLSTLQASKEQADAVKKQRFREIYEKAGPSAHPGRLRKMVLYMAAAAALTGIVLGIYFFAEPVSRTQLADQYIGQHLQTLGVQMNGRSDSIQTGLRLYNDGKLDPALQQFETILRSDTSNFTAREYAGIVALRLKEYDKALRYFGELESYPGLYSNPALFYRALTLMERNGSGDKEQAKQILQKVVSDDLEGKETALEWLKKW